MPQQQFRPPAIPLVTHDPYFSVWSFGDKLTSDWTKHWTGKNQGMCGMVRVDGKAYRWLSPGLRDLPEVTQNWVQTRARSTVVSFTAGGVNALVTFSSPTDILDENALAAPYTAIAFAVESGDGKDHKVEWYFDVSGELVVDKDDQEVTWTRLKVGGGEALAMWCAHPVPLGKVGDDLRIDWGQAVLMPAKSGTLVIGGSNKIRDRFAKSGVLGTEDDPRNPRAVSDDWPVMAWSGSTTVKNPVPGLGVVLAYEDNPALEYFQRRLPPLWVSRDRTFTEELLQAKKSFAKLTGPETPGEKGMQREWMLRFGESFADLATLAYRQCLAGHKLVQDTDGTLLMFSKENFSNGCIGTVDVMYPACPIFLAYNPALLKANMEPIMQYASMPQWKWKFAPHDLGTYPKANGQVYGGGEKTEEDQMPVEESGNMLIMCAAYLDKSNDKAWVEKYWSKLTEWAEYLKAFGLDPGHQLCTDDFAGHLAHNANLSAKAIVAMACYGEMCGVLGHKKDKAYWSELAHKLAREWMKLADDGDHYRLAFDKPGTWSQKYNLVWDKVLGLGLFPQEVYDKEVAWYLKNQNEFGLPLDNRKDYTKLDWTVWTACLASRKEDFEAIMAPVYKWMNETPDRIPLTDWFDTKTAKCVGFRARTVVGGVFMPLLMPKR